VAANRPCSRVSTGTLNVLSGPEVTAVLDRQTVVMEQLSSGASLSSVLDSIVLALEELMPASQCSILLLDEARVLRHGSAPTLPLGYAAAIDGLDGRIHVIDQGPGIPRELLARLFVPFDRLGADAGREGGAGLGLVLARRLTEAMNGTFQLDRTVGVGTHVTLDAAGVRSLEAGTVAG
jgi:light-regulated signal transduction histidine kinase (bacteriophytochrome)